MDLYDRFGANHYSKFKFAVERAKGAEFWDADGKRYIDMLSCYSAVSQGHCNPRIVRALSEQARKCDAVSGAVYNSTIGKCLQKVSEITGMNQVLLKNGGVEGVELSIKAMRAYGYTKKKIPLNAAEIIVAENNFHGRTTTVISFSSSERSKKGFGPYMPGFVSVKYNDFSELEKAVNEHTAGILLEPIQGEGGIIIPSDDYFPKVRELCDKQGILLCLDEIQTGMGRTGKMFCFEHYGIRPDIIIIGKALGGGVRPISGIATSMDIMDTAFKPGNEGSTYAEDPITGAVGLAAIEELLRIRPKEGINLVQRAEKMGNYLINQLKALDHSMIKEVRGKGLLVGIEFYEPIAHQVALGLLREGVFAKDTHETTLRFAPPLMIPKKLVDESVSKLERVLDGFVEYYTGNLG
ncbi:MAG: ornithine--oxo-acid transaminase [Nanoarchaeota archaeon]